MSYMRFQRGCGIQPMLVQVEPTKEGIVGHPIEQVSCPIAIGQTKRPKPIKK